MVLIEGITFLVIAVGMLGWNMHVMNTSGVCCPTNTKRREGEETEAGAADGSGTARNGSSGTKSSTAGASRSSPDADGMRNRRRRIRADQKRKIREQGVAAAVVKKMGVIASGSPTSTAAPVVIAPLPATPPTMAQSPLAGAGINGSVNGGMASAGDAAVVPASGAVAITSTSSAAAEAPIVVSVGA